MMYGMSAHVVADTDIRFFGPHEKLSISLISFFYCFRLIIIASPRMRVYLLRMRFRLVRKEALSILVKESKMGDWFLFYMLGVNVDSIIFR